MVTAIITAAGKSSRMIESQKKRNLKIENKLTLPLKGKTIIENTINNVISANVSSCILILGHFAFEIIEAISPINNDKIKIIENNPINVGLSKSLLNGLNNTDSDLVLCVSGDQPTISGKTYNKLIDSSLNSLNPSNTISVLRRKDHGLLDSPVGLGMPFVTGRENLFKYLKNYNENINPVLREMFSDGYSFHAIKEENELELININTYEEYEYVLDRI